MKVVPALNSLKREADDEGRAEVAGPDVYCSAMFFDRLFGDKQSEPGSPVTFCGEEWFKNSGCGSRRNSDSRVGNNDLHFFFLDAGRNRKNAPVYFLHRVAGVLKAETKTHRVRFVELTSRAFAAIEHQREFTALQGGEMFMEPGFNRPWRDDRR